MIAVDKVLLAVSPKANPAFVKASANAGAIMAEYGITSPAAQAQIIGQMAVECAGFKTFAENMNYSAGRLCQVWPNRFPSIAAAQPYANNPKALASKVYNGRMGNREGSDDGYRFRGSGGLQHTGRSEFERVQRRTSLPVVAFPDRLRDSTNADAIWRGACSYFVDRGALAAAEAGQTETVTRKVNGGVHGLADRKIMVARAANALRGEALIIVESTTQEDADDAKKKAKNATIAAPAGGGASGGATKQADKSDFGTYAAIGVGVIVFVVIAVVAVSYWRRFTEKQTEIETTALKAIDDRLALAA